MRSLTRRTIVGSGLAAALSVSPLLRRAEAQTYPQRPVKIIVPYAAGGASDIIARLIAPELERALGQPFIVDNRGGGASMVGTQAIAAASPEGETIGIVDSAFVINPGLFRTKLPYNTKKDFAPISLLATSPLVLVVHPSVAANGLQEFIALAKAQPGKINFASAGLGTAVHLAGEQLRQAAEIDTLHVPYRGGGPAITDLIGGQVQMTFATVAAIAQQVRQGLVRALAVTGGDRVAQLPNVPTMAEAGLPAVDAMPIFGMVGPAALPPPIIAKLGEVGGKAFRSEPLRSKVTELGFVSVGSSSSEFAARIDDEVAKWTRIVEKGNIQPG
jgi:tripartite-type tricarboxylate transporter receptor subunit TctC